MKAPVGRSNPSPKRFSVTETLICVTIDIVAQSEAGEAGNASISAEYVVI